MTKDDIIQMAKEVGIRLMGDGFGKPDRTDVWATQDEFECFAALVAAAKEKEVLDRLAPVISNAVSKAIIAEREACAKVCEEIARWYSTDIFPEDGTSIDCKSGKMGRVVTKNCAQSIRARGKK
jgi:hypothetical protein